MPVNELWVKLLMLSATAGNGSCGDMDLAALEQEFPSVRAASELCISGDNRFEIVPKDDSLNDILDADSFSAEDIAEMHASPLRVFPAV